MSAGVLDPQTLAASYKAAAAVDYERPWPRVVLPCISQLIANNDAISNPIDINGLKLASDDKSDPTHVN